MVAKETSDEAEGEGRTCGRYLDICVSANRPCTSIKDRVGKGRTGRFKGTERLVGGLFERVQQTGNAFSDWML